MSASSTFLKGTSRYCGFQVACHKKTSHMRNRPIQNVDFELVYCACVEKFVTSNLKTAVCENFY